LQDLAETVQFNPAANLAFRLNESGFSSALINRFRNYRVRDNFQHEVRNEEGCRFIFFGIARCSSLTAFSVQAQQPKKVPRIGYLSAAGSDSTARLVPRHSQKGCAR
jgi:hypothetical protein